MNPIDVSSSNGLFRSSKSPRLGPCDRPDSSCQNGCPGSSSRPEGTSQLGRPPRSLSGLSNRELLTRVKDLVTRERAVTLEILLHLIEVERRRLHVGLGCASMFDYCTRHLGYPSSSAARRIQTARCLRDYPAVYDLLEKNEVNLSTVSLVSPILTRENYEDILGRIRNKSQKEVEAIVVDYRPPVSLRDRARPVWVAVPAAVLGSVPGRSVSEGTRDSTASMAGSAASVRPSAEACAAAPTPASNALPAQRTSGCEYSRCGSGKTPNAAADGVGGPLPVERKYHVQFLASEAFMKKLERARALLSNRNGHLSYEFVLEAALDEFLKAHDPEERNQRREERKQKAEARKGSGECAANQSARSRALTNEESSRRIPAAIRDAVFTRDKGRCTYVSPNGARCGVTHHLQIDHVVPYARGGTHAVNNLRLLCERHNKVEAERILGANAVRRFRRRE